MSSRSIICSSALLLLLGLLAFSATAHAECCVVADNGSGTATLPPITTGATCIDLGTSEITSGLPAGTTIQIVISFGFFINQNEYAGGGLGGTVSEWDGLCEMQMTGTGLLTGFSHTVQIPLNGTQNNMMEWAPRTAYAPVQTATADVYRFFGQTFSHPQFDLLRVAGGNDFGMPSPGQIQLVQTAGSWAVSGYFDLTHRIDYIGSLSGSLAGYSGSSTVQRRFEICPQTVADEDMSWSQIKAIYGD
jgi:hypothetical protein